MSRSDSPSSAIPDHDQLNVTKYDLKYTRCYCEENIYLLCQEIKEKQNDLLKCCSVIYISNDNRMVPLWKQKAGVREQPVVWDYHVILYFQKTSDSIPLVYDYDTVLSFPCPVDNYIMETFKPEYILKQRFDRYFRMISAEMYLDGFSSDRSHMRKQDGTWFAEPPTYPPIQAGEEVMNLHEYISMGNNSKQKYGMVHSSQEFYFLINKQL